VAGALCVLLPFAGAGVASAGPASAGRARGHLEARPVRVAQTNDAPERPSGGSAGLGAGGGIDRVVLRFEGAVPAAVTALAESDLRTAFGRRGVDVVRRQAGSSPLDASGVTMTIALASERLEQIALRIEERSAGAVAFTLSRRLDLNAFPADGRILALVVAADEMLVAAGTEHGRGVRGSPPGGAGPPPPGVGEAEATPAPTPAAPNPVPPAPAERLAEVAQKTAPREPTSEERATASPSPWRTNELAATFAFDHFGGGQTHLGLDLAWRRRLRGRWHASLAAQGRQGRTVTTSTGTIDSRLLGGRAALGFTLADDEGRLWLTLDAGARSGWLQFEGRGTAPDGRKIGHRVDTFFGYVDATLALDVRLGRSPLALRLAVGAGLPLLAQDAASGDGAVTGASGVALESQAGLVVNF